MRQFENTGALTMMRLDYNDSSQYTNHSPGQLQCPGVVDQDKTNSVVFLWTFLLHFDLFWNFFCLFGRLPANFDFQFCGGFFLFVLLKFLSQIFKRERERIHIKLSE